jgi:TonB family protein
MKNLLILTLLVLPFISFSQEGDKQVNFSMTTQQEAYYPKGDKALFEYFNKNIKYNQYAADKKITGTVIISFYVQADSTIVDASVLSGLGYGIDEEVIRCIKQLKFAPAIMNKTQMRSNVILNVNVKAEAPKEMIIEKH